MRQARTESESTVRTQAASRVLDAPLGTVKLDLLGAAKGLIQNSEPLSGANFTATVAMHGQNGKVLNRKVPLQSVCDKKHANATTAPEPITTGGAH